MITDHWVHGDLHSVDLHDQLLVFFFCTTLRNQCVRSTRNKEEKKRHCLKGRCQPSFSTTTLSPSPTSRFKTRVACRIDFYKRVLPLHEGLAIDDLTWDEASWLDQVRGLSSNFPRSAPKIHLVSSRLLIPPLDPTVCSCPDVLESKTRSLTWTSATRKRRSRQSQRNRLSLSAVAENVD